MHPIRNASLLSLVLLAGTMSASAADGPVTMKTMAMGSLLNANLNQRITLLMQSGRDISGLVNNIGANTVHIRSIQGKEFYDAVVRIDAIEAVMARVRNR